MRITTGYYASENGSKYLQQLCKHFQHKITVRFDAEEGRFATETGTAHLRADTKGLTVQLTAEDAKGLIDLRYALSENTEIVNKLLVESGEYNTFAQNDLGLSVTMNSMSHTWRTIRRMRGLWPWPEPLWK